MVTVLTLSNLHAYHADATAALPFLPASQKGGRGPPTGLRSRKEMESTCTKRRKADGTEAVQLESYLGIKYQPHSLMVCVYLQKWYVCT